MRLFEYPVNNEVESMENEITKILKHTPYFFFQEFSSHFRKNRFQIIKNL